MGQKLEVLDGGDPRIDLYRALSVVCRRPTGEQVIQKLGEHGWRQVGRRAAPQMEVTMRNVAG